MNAAEAAVDTALMALRQQVNDPDHAWTGWTFDQANASYYREYNFTGNNTAGNQLSARIVVDAPNQLRQGRNQWYRIRSIGTATIPGKGHSSGDSLDARIRRYSLKKDRTTGDTLTKPQVSRAIEVIARPVAAFDIGMLGVNYIGFNNQNILIDSFDSSVPSKSSNGLYDPSKRQQNGDIATNGQLIDAGNAHVYGRSMTNNGTTIRADNVTGELRNDFFRDILNIPSPGWTTWDSAPGGVTSISGSTTLVAGSGTPTKYKLSSIALTGGSELVLDLPPGQTSGEMEIWVTGDIKTSGNGQITVKPGVKASVFFEQDVDITGNGIINQSNFAGNY